MDVISILNKRHSAKSFDANRKLDEATLEKIESILQLAPSSTNIQPWQFMVATSEEGKKRIAKSTQGFYIFNEKKVLDASAVVVFSTRTEVGDEFMKQVLAKEEADGRFPEEIYKAQNDGARRIFADMHLFDYRDQQHWLDKQVYLNLGNFLLGVASLGLDALPMEGFDAKVLSEEFGLKEKGLTPVLVVSVGYGDVDNFNASLPKSRLSKELIIERI